MIVSLVFIFQKNSVNMLQQDKEESKLIMSVMTEIPNPSDSELNLFAKLANQNKVDVQKMLAVQMTLPPHQNTTSTPKNPRSRR